VLFSDPKYGDDRTHTELAWSPDTTTWHRIEPGVALVPNSPKKGDYDWGTIYASQPVVLKNEIRIYYGGGNGAHTDWRKGFLMLATLRPDGFAGYEPVDANESGVVISRSLVCGKELKLTADAKGGMVSVAVADAAGNVLAQSEPVTDDVTDQVVSWKDGGALQAFAGQTIVLRWEIRRAKLYAFAL
jgi:hypothetical protein